MVLLAVRMVADVIETRDVIPSLGFNQNSFHDLFSTIIKRFIEKINEVID